MSGWLILRTRPHFELKLETAVQQIGVCAYVPEIVTKRRHPFTRVPITVRKAIYPGYVFAREHFPAEQITTTKLSAHWLKDGDRMAQISERLMDQIEAGERIGCAVEEAFEILRMTPIAKKLAKRAAYTKDFKAALGRAA